MNEYFESGVYVYAGIERDFNYRTNLSASQKISFISNVVNIVVNDDMYYDFLTEIIFGFEVINEFTDVDMFDITELITDDQIEIIEDFLNGSNIIDVIYENVEYDVIAELRNNVELAIEYKTGIRKNSIDESLANIINTIDDAISGIDLNEISDMAKMLGDISGELTPAKILEAYSKSDMYKSNSDRRKK